MTVDAALVGDSWRERFRRRRAGLLALSLWCSAWLALAPTLLHRYRDAFFGNGLTPSSVMQGPLALLKASFGMDIFDVGVAIVVIGFVLLLVVLTVLEWLAWRCRFDPADLTVTSLRWTLRAVPTVIAWSFAGVVLIGIAVKLAQPLDTIAGLVVIGTAGAIAWSILPFISLNRDELQRDVPGWFWRPAWPGWQAVVAGLALFIVTVGLNWFTSDFLGEDSLPLSVTTVIDLAVFVVTLWPSSAFLYLWINRTGFSNVAGQAHRVFSWRTLAALFLIDARVTVWFLLGAGVPILVSALLLIFVIPQVQEFNRATGEMFSWPMSLAIQVSAFFRDYWWAFAPSLLALLFSARGRLYVLLGMVRSDG